ncbi:hypothetical protein D9M70_458200 [compost metagenome]
MLKIEVTDLVAKVSKQGSVGLPHRNTNGLANDVISLCRSKTDQPILVPGHRRADVAAFIDCIFQKVEHQPVFRVDVSSGTRKAKAQNGIEQMALGRANSMKPSETLRGIGVGDEPIVTCRNCQTNWIVGRNQPVAPIYGCVGTEPPGFARP